MKLHILTAVTRPENLPRIRESIITAWEWAHGVDPIWHMRSDPDRRFVGGQRLKNEMLEDIKDGWVVILDDDTVMHEKFMRKVNSFADSHGNAIVVSQKRVNGMVLQAAPENAVVGGIDAGQAVLRRSFIGDYRIPETYAGDGMWLEVLLRDRTDVHYLPSSVLSLHNAISGVDEGPRQ